MPSHCNLIARNFAYFYLEHGQRQGSRHWPGGPIFDKRGYGACSALHLIGRESEGGKEAVNGRAGARGGRGKGQRKKARFLPSSSTFGDAVSRDEMSDASNGKDRGAGTEKRGGVISLVVASPFVSRFEGYGLKIQKAEWDRIQHLCPCVYISKDNMPIPFIFISSSCKMSFKQLPQTSFSTKVSDKNEE